MTLTQFELGQKRARKRLKRKKIIADRLRNFGMKSKPIYIFAPKPIIHCKLKWWQRVLGYFGYNI